MVGTSYMMHGTHGDDVVKDHLDKVSGRLRKAVGLNRHEIGGLRNVVSQMNRERNRSVGILSKQQQDFIQKQAKLLPALGIDKRRSKKTANQVIPLDLNESAQGMQLVNGQARTKANNYRILPPISRWNRATKDECNLLEHEAKQKRISDYQKEFSSLQESLNNASKFANNQTSTDNVIFEPEAATVEKMTDAKKHLRQQKLERFKEVVESNGNKLNISIQELRPMAKDNTRPLDLNAVGEIDMRINIAQRSKVHEKVPDEIDLVAFENKVLSGTHIQRRMPVSNWGVVRNRLRSIAAMNKKRHSQYLDKLYDEIRKCRYIRKPKKTGDSDEDDFVC